LNIHASSWNEIQDYCLSKINPSLRVLAAESGGGKSLWTADLKSPLALVIGGEAEGPSPEAKNLVTEDIHIPMPGNFESLNAGVAASILLFEIIRQRQS
jgi:RNA methyltransferase, TrmH family